MSSAPERPLKPYSAEKPHPSKDEQWAESERNKVIERLKNEEELLAVLESLPGFDEAVRRELDTIACSDERVPVEKGGKIGFAGQLILLSDDELEQFVETYRDKIKMVTAHDGCGAAGFKFNDLAAEGIAVYDGRQFATADELGAYFSQKLAKRLGAEYEYIKTEAMSNDIHNARMICFDGTGSFSPADIPDLPAHYVCSAPGYGLSKEYQVNELKILVGKIALDDHHGFGTRFTPDSPFYIVVSAKDELQQKELIETAQEAVAEFGQRVRVKGFVQPTAEEIDIREAA